MGMDGVGGLILVSTQKGARTVGMARICGVGGLAGWSLRFMPRGGGRR